MTKIADHHFAHFFQARPLDELVDRAREQGIALSDAERRELASADRDRDGIIGNDDLERNLVFRFLDRRDRDGSRSTLEGSRGFDLAKVWAPNAAPDALGAPDEDADVTHLGTDDARGLAGQADRMAREMESGRGDVDHAKGIIDRMNAAEAAVP